MIEELLAFVLLINVWILVLNIWTYNKLQAERKETGKIREEYFHLLLCGKHSLFKQLGAYEVEGGKMYLDLFGIRLVISEGKIEGWYVP